jgi:chemotaxis protein MotB
MKKPAATEEEKKPRRRIKKVAGHGGHHGGAWKVAYADFVTAMMALFLVLWLVSQADTKLKQSIASYFRSPGVFDTMDGGILPNAKKVSKEPTALTSKDEEQTLFAVSEALKKKFEKKPEFSKIKDKVQIELTEEGIRIEIIDKADQISFQVGGTELSDDAKLILSEIAKAICELSNPLVIGGHTDARVFPSQNGYTNWELSTDRANSARRYLESQCVKPEQIRRIIGYADSKPIYPRDPYSPANRRISIVVVRNILPDKVASGSVGPDSQKPEPTTFDPNNRIPERQDVIEKESNSIKPEIPKLTKPNSNVNAANSANTLVPTANISVDTKPPGTTKKRSEEVLEAEKKLKKNGMVVIGEPDDIPKRPR